MSTPSTDDTRADAPLPTASHEPAADSPPPTNAQMRFGVTKRRLQIWLGCLWIIVGLFKFQPDLFGASFIQDVVGSMAAGQPGLIRVSITHMATFLSHEATWWVVVFGLVEIAIGVGMLVARTVKVALASSVVWGLAIYWFGEGFGGVFTGQASPLAGAPGAACFYALLAVVI